MAVSNKLSRKPAQPEAATASQPLRTILLKHAALMRLILGPEVMPSQKRRRWWQYWQIKKNDVTQFSHAQRWMVEGVVSCAM